MNPFAAEFPGVLALNDRKIVANIGTVEKLVDVWLQEKRLAEAEVGTEAHSGVWNCRWINRFARPRFTSVSEMSFVEHAVGKSTEPVGADRLDFRWAFDTIGAGSVSGHIEGLI